MNQVSSSNSLTARGSTSGTLAPNNMASASNNNLASSANPNTNNNNNTTSANTTATTTTTTFTSNIINGIVQQQMQQISIDETPNKLVYKKIESVIEKMQEDQGGVPIRTVKSFMSKIPSVFTGTDLIQWMLKKLDVEDTVEALHFAHLIASHGYMFPIDDHILTVKNDGTFFRFQVNFEKI